MPKVLGELTCPMCGYHWGPKSKVEKIENFSNDFFKHFFDVLDIIGVQ